MILRPTILLLLIGVLAGCGRKAVDPVARRASAPSQTSITTAVAVLEEIPTVTEVTGTIQAVQRAQLASRLMGAIEEMPVILGQRVHAGDILVKIDAADASARAAQARTQLGALQRELERERGLAVTGASAKENVRNFEDRVSAAEAQLREAEAMLAYAVVRAPFDGVVARKPAEVGDLAVPGVPLLELHGLDRFEIEAAIPETAAARLKVGDAVEATVSATAVSFSGAITEVSSAADVQARAITFKIAVPPGITVYSGQFTRLRLTGPPRQAILVPSSAVTRVGQMERVFTVTTDGRAVLHLVKVGGAHDNRLEILAGLTPGDRIILDPPASLRDGQSVEEGR